MRFQVSQRLLLVAVTFIGITFCVMNYTLHNNPVPKGFRLPSYSVVRRTLQEANLFGHCDAMNDVMAHQIVLLTPIRLVYCPIPKNMHTQMWALFLGAYQNTTFVLDNGTDLYRFWESRTERIGKVGEMVVDAFGEQIDKLKSVDSFQYFTLIRHPFDRFISAFQDICLTKQGCDGPDANYCKNNLHCILDLLKALEQNCSWYQSSCTTLTMFHFVPQAYMCYLRKLKSSSQILFYENTPEFRETLTDYVLRAGISPAVVWSGWGHGNTSWLNATTYHKTCASASFAIQKQQILNNATMLQQLFDIYQADFKMFQFAMPNSVEIHCAKVENYRDGICNYLLPSR